MLRECGNLISYSTSEGRNKSWNDIVYSYPPAIELGFEENSIAWNNLRKILGKLIYTYLSSITNYYFKLCFDYYFNYK